MQKFSHTAIGVEQGTKQLFSAFQDDGEMWTGSGPRVERGKVRFTESFISPPVIHVSLCMWDIDSDANQRTDISAENITTEGFGLVFRTWEDTKVARVRAAWLAIGAVRHETDFDV